MYKAKNNSNPIVFDNKFPEIYHRNLTIFSTCNFNQLSASVVLIQKPVNWFAQQINWMASTWGQHWHLRVKQPKIIIMVKQPKIITKTTSFVISSCGSKTWYSYLHESEKTILFLPLLLEKLKGELTFFNISNCNWS